MTVIFQSAVGLLLVFFLAGTCARAQEPDQSSDSGVLVSPPPDAQTDNASVSPKKQRAVQPAADAPHVAAGNAGNEDASPKDDIVIKSANTVIFQMKANLKLTQDQIDAARPIVEDNIAKVRALQQKLEDGLIDGKAMYTERNQLILDENNQLAAVLTADQLKLWISIESQNYVPPARK